MKKFTKMFILSISIISFCINAKEPENNKIETFSYDAIKSINNFNYSNIEKKWNEKESYFTESGWNEYLLNLKNSKLVDTIKTYQMSMTTVHMGKITILPSNSDYYDILTPIRTKYKSDNKKENVTIVTHGVIFMKIVAQNNSYKIKSYQLIETGN